jgi:hypothetical protein
MNPIDERMHPVRDEPAWSESYYFNFVDPDTKVAMFTRMGFRPGDGWADGLHVVYLGGDRVAFTYGRRSIQKDLTQYDGDLVVGGLRLECAEPFGLWRVGYWAPRRTSQTRRSCSSAASCGRRVGFAMPRCRCPSISVR